jgi:hypothetical protein
MVPGPQQLVGAVPQTGRLVPVDVCRYIACATFSGVCRSKMTLIVLRVFGPREAAALVQALTSARA